MKKLLGIIVLSLFWCNSSYSITPSCQSTNYVSPCTCKYSDNAFEKFQCERKKEKALKPKKKTRGDAIEICSRESEEHVKEIRAEVYKDCMKDKGFR
jgi:hypothetical protein|tara:strand:- start:40 stop:330 length:291 start_codon:yes stop_codon:yes gene_type:complete